MLIEWDICHKTLRRGFIKKCLWVFVLRRGTLVPKSTLEGEGELCYQNHNHILYASYSWTTAQKVGHEITSKVCSNHSFLSVFPFPEKRLLSALCLYARLERIHDEVKYSRNDNGKMEQFIHWLGARRVIDVLSGLPVASNQERQAFRRLETPWSDLLSRQYCKVGEFLHPIYIKFPLYASRISKFRGLHLFQPEVIYKFDFIFRLSAYYNIVNSFHVFPNTSIAFAWWAHRARSYRWVNRWSAIRKPFESLLGDVSFVLLISLLLLPR